MKKMNLWTEKQHYSIRKYAFGAASVLIGASLLLGGQAQADQQASPNPADQAPVEALASPGGAATPAAAEANQVAASSAASSDSKDSAEPVSPAIQTQKAEVAPETDARSQVAADSISAPASSSPEVAKADAASQTDDLSQVSASPASQSKAADVPASQTQADVQPEVAPASQAKPSQSDSSQAASRASAATSAHEVGKDLPSSGYYTYPEKTEVKNSPSASAPLAFYANAGDKVYYDQVLKQDGYQWLSYKSYSGIRRYANIAKLSYQASEPQAYQVKGELDIKNVSDQGFDVVVSQSADSKGIKAVKVPVWSQADGQDDMIWYSADKQTDGTYKVRVNTSDHKGQSGKYYVHLYYVENDDKTVGVAAKDVVVPQADKSYSEETLPSLERYTFDQRVEVKSQPKLSAKTDFTFEKGEGINYDKKIKSDGYNWISYKSYSGQRRYIKLDRLNSSDTSQGQAEQISGQISIENQSKDGFDVRISNVSDSNGLLAVKVPVWTQAGDQDDMVWYTAAKQADGTYKVSVKRSDHKNEYGRYNIHLYYVETNGAMKGVAASDYELAQPKVERTGKLTFEDKADGNFDIVVSNVSDSQGLKEVKVPVWTDKGGQDDMVWYTAAKQADGTYKVVVKRSDHKNEYGTYHAHLYYLENDGSLVGIAAQEHDLVPSKVSRTGTLSFSHKDNGDFDVIVSDVTDSQGLKEVKVPVWTDKGGQDDMVWYTATKQGDGTYKVSVKRSNHKNETGTYNVHLYYLEDDGQLVGVAASQTTSRQEDKRTGEVDIQNKSAAGFDVVITNVSDSRGLKEVKVPVWTQAGDQDDMIWYTATKQSDGSYKVHVKTADHKGETGRYNVHLYYLENDGNLVGVATRETTLPQASSSQAAADEEKTLSALQSYSFTKTVEVRNTASLSAPVAFTFKAGDKVNYDKTLRKDGHDWISYLSYGGQRRYVLVD